MNLAISILERHENRLTRELATVHWDDYDPEPCNRWWTPSERAEREVRHAALKALERLQRT